MSQPNQGKSIYEIHYWDQKRICRNVVVIPTTDLGLASSVLCEKKGCFIVGSMQLALLGLWRPIGTSAIYRNCTPWINCHVRPKLN